MTEAAGAAARGAEAFPLSRQQRRAWLFEAARGGGDGSAALVVECAVDLAGPLDVPRLERAVAEVAERHESLRTGFWRGQGMRLPFQVVHAGPPRLERRDEADGGDDSPLVVRPDGPLVRLALARRSADRHRLQLTASALVADGESLLRVVRETALAYAGAALVAEPVQVVDYADWQDERLADGGDAARVARAFWAPWQREGLRFTPLPEEAPQAGLFTPEHGPLLPALLADEERLLAAWCAYLFRVGACGEGEVVVANRFDGRDAEDLEDSVGPFARALPLAVSVTAVSTLDELTAGVAVALREAEAHRAYGDGAWDGERPLALPAAFRVERRPEPLEAAGVVFAPAAPRGGAEPYVACLTAVRQGGGLEMALDRDATALSAAARERLEASFRGFAAAAAAAPDRAVGELPLLPESERRRLLVDFNAAARLAPPAQPIHLRVAEHARRDPAAPALRCGERLLTYGELAGCAAALGAVLRDHGVGPEDRVAIVLERGEETVIALLAALWAGGAYACFDAAQPPERLAALLRAVAPRVVVCRGTGAVEAAAPVVDLAAGPVAGVEAPPAIVPGESLAYVLFTSGSTGEPKGVSVEHRQLTSYVDAILSVLDLPVGATFAATASLAADLGHTALFGALAAGGCFHLIDAETAGDPGLFADLLARHPVDCLKIVPSHLAALVAAAGDAAPRVLPRRCLVLGGEAFPAALAARVRELAPGLALFNHYGPTETTVGATAQRIAAASATATVPIGRPLPGVRGYVVDEARQPLPVGVAGELWIGGAGVARGYLGRPAATAERFVPDPFAGVAGARAYRTGDRVRHLAGGGLEFLGRGDRQVKLRGHRIEPGEVEAAMRAHPAVAEAAVVLREDEPGERRLVGYAVGRPGATLDLGELRAHLDRVLPEVMVPVLAPPLLALPRTASGKIDRGALPAPPRRRGGEVGGRPPAGEAERMLAGIWAEVLRLPAVGVDDNFFELGGDSILSIEVIARANRAGLRLSPRQIFQHQTIAELAAVAGSGPAPTAAPRARGEAPMTPIQERFFALDVPHRDHWNQSLLLAVRLLDPAALRAALERLVEAHDSLRLRFPDSPAGSRQVYEDAAAAAVHRIDLSALPSARRRAGVESAAAAVQRSLDLRRGPVARFAMLDLDGGETWRLLLTVHHLVVDAVSWRILLADLLADYRRLAAGEEPDERPRTTSYGAWSERLRQHLASGALAGELEHWQGAVPADAVELPQDLPGAPGRQRDERQVATSLSAEETAALVDELPAAYLATVEEILLSALTRAIAAWSGSQRLVVELEGHGREPLFDDVDLSRTVGWFTTRYPVCLEVDGGRGPAATLAAVKERLRQVPGRGIGYGVLRDLDRGSGGEALRRQPRPPVSFNYLGRFDGVADGDGAGFATAEESMGPEVDPAAERPNALAVTARIAGGRLEARWSFDRRRHRHETIEALARSFADELRALLAGRSAPGRDAFVPSDFPLAELDTAGLERLLGRLSDGRAG